MPTAVSCTLMFLQQFSGINAVISYAVQLFTVRCCSARQHCTGCQDAGVGVDPFVCNILVALTQSVFVVVSMLLVDRLVLS